MAFALVSARYPQPSRMIRTSGLGLDIFHHGGTAARRRHEKESISTRKVFQTTENLRFHIRPVIGNPVILPQTEKIMSVSELLLLELDEEMKKTRTTLERVPTDKKDFAPHAKSMPLGKLAPHGAQLAGFGFR